MPGINQVWSNIKTSSNEIFQSAKKTLSKWGSRIVKTKPKDATTAKTSEIKPEDTGHTKSLTRTEGQRQLPKMTPQKGDSPETAKPTQVFQQATGSEKKVRFADTVEVREIKLSSEEKKAIKEGLEEVITQVGDKLKSGDITQGEGMQQYAGFVGKGVPNEELNQANRLYPLVHELRRFEESTVTINVAGKELTLDTTQGTEDILNDIIDQLRE